MAAVCMAAVSFCAFWPRGVAAEAYFAFLGSPAFFASIARVPVAFACTSLGEEVPVTANASMWCG